MQSLFSKPYKFIPIDFSEGSQFSTRYTELPLADFSAELFDFLDGRVGYGGYLERRSLYKASELFFERGKGKDRNIHLGVDFWAPAGTEIICPVDATIHSFQYNANKLDYGNTIIVEIAWRVAPLFLLFGHLSNDSLNYIATKETIKKGERIGWLGDFSENGGWPPHLHFQCIRDLQGCVGDYPGLCGAEELAFYRGNCLDPMDVFEG